MSTTLSAPPPEPTSVPRPPRAAADGPVAGIGLARLTRVEARKLVDTRAGCWFLAVMALGSLALTLITVVDNSGYWFDAYLQAATMPLALLLPVLGVLAATSEWSQRTAMTTFTLEPRRGRVVAAKVLAALVVGVVAFAVAFLVAALGHGFVTTVLGGDGRWTFTAPTILGLALLVVFGLLQGLAFGLALLNTPVAVVAYFALPTLFGILAMSLEVMRDIGPWLDFSQSTQPLRTPGAEMSGEQWAQLATTFGVWVLLPLSFGVWRVLRAEVK